jgi:hypothetical protein
MSHCSAERLRTTAELIAEALIAVPDAGQAPVSVRQLFLDAGVENADEAAGMGLALAALLRPFGALQVIGDDSHGSPTVTATNGAAGFFLRSLSAFLLENLPLLTNWERPGNSDGPYEAHEVLAGPQFLYLMERARTAHRADAMVLRRVRAVKVVIKSRARGTTNDVYLLHFDPDARQYQLVGGYERGSDPDLESTATLEIAEELHLNRFEFPQRDRVVRLNESPIRVRSVSRTHAAATEYELHFFLLHRAGDLRRGPSDIWVTKAELLAGLAHDGIGINASGLVELDASLPGGLDGLTPSIAEVAIRGTSRRPGGGGGTAR